MGVLVFAELSLCARGGWYVLYVLTPAFYGGLRSLFGPLPLEGWAGLLLISEFTCKVELGFSHLAKTPRSWPRGCICPTAAEVPRSALGTTQPETFSEPGGTMWLGFLTPPGLIHARNIVQCRAWCSPALWYLSELPSQVFGPSRSLCSAGRW